MLPEETVLGDDIRGDLGEAVLEHGGDPRGAYMAVEDDIEFVDHPIDGLATVALAKAITVSCVVHLGFGD